MLLCFAEVGSCKFLLYRLAFSAPRFQRNAKHVLLRYSIISLGTSQTIRFDFCLS